MSSGQPMDFTGEPFATNTLAMKRYFAWYLVLLTLSSILPLYLVLLTFFIEIPANPPFTAILFWILLPLQVVGIWVVFILCAIFFTRILLSIVNLFHKPREGVFLRSSQDKDYRYWSLRSTIKKFAFWAAHTFPLPWLDIVAYKAFGVKTSFHTAYFNVWVDSEFIEVGINTMFGLGAVVLSAAVIGDYLIIKKVQIGKNVLVGAHTFISPGTIIGDDVVLGVLSSTSIGQSLDAGYVYMGNPAKKLKENRYSVAPHEWSQAGSMVDRDEEENKARKVKWDNYDEKPDDSGGE